MVFLFHFVILIWIFPNKRSLPNSYLRTNKKVYSYVPQRLILNFAYFLLSSRAQSKSMFLIMFTVKTVRNVN